MKIGKCGRCGFFVNAERHDCDGLLALALSPEAVAAIHDAERNAQAEAFREVPPASPLAALKGATERAEAAAERRCAACGQPERPHNFRHPFEPPTGRFTYRGPVVIGAAAMLGQAQRMALGAASLAEQAGSPILGHALRQLSSDAATAAEGEEARGPGAPDGSQGAPTPAAMLAEALEHLRRAEVLVREVWRRTGRAEGVHEAVAVALSEALCAQADSEREAEAREPGHGR